MTKPTQAQIEAAAVELSSEKPWPWECCLEIARLRALTAAAEAEGAKGAMKPNQARQAAAKAIRLQFALHPASITAENLNNDAACELLAEVALTAAAEVGPYAGMQVDKNGLVVKYTDKDLDDTEAATIERCAEELDRLMMRAAAAAIRALKDKP